MTITFAREYSFYALLAKAVARVEADFPDSHPSWIAERAVGVLTPAERRGFLLEEATGLVEEARRTRVRRLEDAARQAALTKQQVVDHDQRIVRWETQGCPMDRSGTYPAVNGECWRGHPIDHAAYEARLAAQREAWRAHPEHAPRHSRAYREWAVTPEAMAFFARREADAAASRAHWAERERIRVEEPERYAKEFTIQGYLDTAIAEVKAQARMELTQELLSATIALGDGTRTTWGAATLLQHEQRRNMLMKSAAGTAETAALHEYAIQQLIEAHCSTLTDLYLQRQEEAA
jgi:hypothetical protein